MAGPEPAASPYLPALRSLPPSSFASVSLPAHGTTPNPSPPPADAFETLMEILRMRRDYPGVEPEKYGLRDQRFADFIDCKLGKRGRGG
jgi:hypothetical protein